MDIEVDPAKDAANIAKHGVSLAFGEAVFSDPDHIVLPSHRRIDGEDRFKAIGRAGDASWTAMFVVRGEVIRFISVRRSNGGEEAAYHRPLR